MQIATNRSNNLVQLCEKLSSYKDLFESTLFIKDKSQCEKKVEAPEIFIRNSEEFLNVKSELIKCKNEIKKVQNDKEIVEKQLQETNTLCEKKNDELLKQKEMEKELNYSLEKSNSKNEHLEKQLSFQKNVSKYLAYYCKSLHNNVASMQQQFSQLETALKVIRTNYDSVMNRLASYENFLNGLKGLIDNYKRKENNSFQTISERDCRIAELTNEIHELKIRDESSNKVTVELTGQLEYQKDIQERMKKELETLASIVEKQTKLIEKEQHTSKKYMEELEELRKLSSSETRKNMEMDEYNCRISGLEDKISSLNAMIDVEKGRYEELCKQHDESIKSLHLKLYNLNKEREEDMMRKIEESGIQKADTSCDRFGLDRGNNLKSSLVFSDLSSMSNNRFVGEGNRFIHSIEHEEEDDDDDEEFFSLIPKTSVNVKSNIERLKCCSELPIGQLMNCSKCKSSFHKSCVERMTPSAKKKGFKFVCHLCRPLAGGTRKKSLSISIE